ncbi:MAG: sigma-54-dependent Fis family transcriptional regulator [Deltaproteobacteria bacterium]|nr:sigma-54-dependent Fis family transcriptional regulator [Candidatus Zymogenaceae bacterium]
MKYVILVIDDEVNIVNILTRLLEGKGYEVHTALTGARGLDLAARIQPDLVLLDLMLPDMSGLDVLRRIHEGCDETQVVMLTGYGSVKSVIETMKAGAVDYLTKPAGEEQLLLTVEKNLKNIHLIREIEFLREQDRKKYSFNYLVGRSKGVMEIYRNALSVARSDSTTILIQGDSGTGKEFLARFIHYRSNRGEAPFVEINCAAIPENLMESELFGYEPGAFTDARIRKQGQFELAAGGTIFLDEIGDMSMLLQAKLLKFLDSMTFKRVGGTRDITLDIRIIAATNKDLGRAVEAGEFRNDLYYRLKVVEFSLPGLVERRQDIELFARAFLEECAKRLKRKVTDISDEAVASLEEYHWPGNIRELRNVIERAVIVCDGEVVEPKHLTLSGPDMESRTGGDDPLLATSLPEEGIDFQKTIENVSRELITKAIRTTDGNRSHAARLLGIPRQVLLYQMKKLGIDDE